MSLAKWVPSHFSPTSLVRKLTSYTPPAAAASEVCGNSCGHELLSIISRYAQILLSTLDPGSVVAKATYFRLPLEHEPDEGQVLKKTANAYALAVFFTRAGPRGISRLTAAVQVVDI